VGFEQLIKKSIEQDRKAQEQLYKLLAPKLFAVCLKYSKNDEEAKDTLQDGFIVIFNKLSQFQNKGSFEGWAKRIMINLCLQQYRNSGVLELINENIPDEEEIELDHEDISLDFLLKIIQELPDRYRLVFNLYLLDGYSHKEIATMLMISEGTSKSNLARAKMILKNKIENGLKDQEIKFVP
jgi:RNA polymerase sigma-70 factor (ECF subfamily)